MMATLFQKGERVLVKRSLSDEDCCFGLVWEMKDFCGEVVTIADAYKLQSDDANYGLTTGRYCVLEDPDDWMWSDNCFEKLQPEIEDVDIDVNCLI